MESESGSSQQDDSSKSSSNNLQSSGNNSTSLSFHNGGSDEDFQTIKDALGRQEEKQVIRLRLLVVLVLVAAATCVSWTVFFITKSAGEDEFELKYHGVAYKIIESFQEIMIEMSAVSGLAVTATTHARQQMELLKLSNKSDVIAHSDWPFVTLQNFQERVGNVRSLSGAIYVSINPIVDANQLPFWEDYVRGDAASWMYVSLMLGPSVKT